MSAKVVAQRGLICLDCGTEYPTVDALVASGHWIGEPCAEARPRSVPRSNYCIVSDHSRCRGRIPSASQILCQCRCHGERAA